LYQVKSDEIRGGGNLRRTEREKLGRTLDEENETPEKGKTRVSGICY